MQNRGAPVLGWRDAFSKWRNDLIAKPSFQRWASRMPLVRRVAAKDGEKLFDLVAGFVHSQTLFAVVELGILPKLTDRPQSAAQLALSGDVPPEKMEILCMSAASLGLLERRSDGRFALARLGAAMLGVPGLIDMVRHHDILYRDLRDPVALLRDEVETELAAFWPYVLGQGAEAPDAVTVARYSDLMAQSQAIVAQETLQSVSFGDIQALMDIGGGTGAFAKAVQAAYPDMRAIVFDLPDVVRDITGLESLGGSFLDPLPKPAGGHVDAISLIRVLFDHEDQTVETLLSNVYNALPSGGQVIISEPMSGGARPQRATDSYFAFYTMAMRTGRVRSQARIGEMLDHAGFVGIRTPHATRPFVTSLVTAKKP